MAKPDSKKIFFENLSGAGKAIAVLTSGGDAQGKILTQGISEVNTPVCSWGQARRWRNYTLPQV